MTRSHNQHGQNADMQQSELVRHWRRFKKGLLLFVVGALFIIAGYKWHPLLQVPGLILLIPAMFLAGWGYWGILKLRLRNSFSIRKN